MSKLESQFEEDRELRDAARAMFRRELEHARHEIAPKAVGERIATTIGAKAGTASDAAIGFAQRHARTAAATAIAGAATAGLWFARKPILSGIAALKERGKQYLVEKAEQPQHKDSGND